jgi:hypothetical protein
VPGRAVESPASRTTATKWQITIVHEGREYEIELHPTDFRVLRLDYA